MKENKLLYEEHDQDEKNSRRNLLHYTLNTRFPVFLPDEIMINTVKRFHNQKVKND